MAAIKNLFPKFELRRIYKNKSRLSSPGFTLLEVLIYTIISFLIVVIITTLAVFAMKIGTKVKANYEVTNNARRVMETLTYEIKRSRSVYAPTSVFDANPGQLSLEQPIAAGSDESLSYIDFFKCGDDVCLRRDAQTPVKITNGQIKVTNLTFSQILNELDRPSIQITLEIDCPANRPDYGASISVVNSVDLRTY